MAVVVAAPVGGASTMTVSFRKPRRSKPRAMEAVRGWRTEQEILGAPVYCECGKEAIVTYTGETSLHRCINHI